MRIVYANWGRLDACRCGRRPEMIQWGDTVNPNATWVECECGMMTDTMHDEDAEEAKRLAAVIWNGG